MRFYNRQHRHYCGIDLHVKAMYLCILNSTGQVLLHKNVKTTPQAFLEARASTPPACELSPPRFARAVCYPSGETASRSNRLRR
jgi:hypothetical protein